MASILATVISSLLEMDHIGIEELPDATVYVFKTTALSQRGVEIKAKILSMLDFPVDVPFDVEVKEVKSNPIFKEYIVKIYVKKSGIGKIRNLLASKYGLIKRPYIKD